MWKTGQASGNKMARWLSPPVYSSGPEMPIEVRDGVSVVVPEEGTWTDLEPAYETVMLDEKDVFLWIETIWTKVILTRLSPSLMDLEFRGTVEARGWVYLSQELENAMVVGLVLGTAPDQLFRQAEREVVWAACQRAEMEMERMEVRVELGDRKNMRRPLRTMRLGKEMTTEEGIDDQQSGGNQGTNGDGERNEGSTRDRESAKLEGTREDGKDASIGESSGKAGGSKRGPQENREGGNDMRTSPRNSAGATPKKTKVSDASRKLAEIEKQTAEFKARLIEQMMAEDEEDPQGAGSREGRRTGQDESRYEEKDNSHKGTPSKKGKDKNAPPAEGTKNAMTPPAIDSDTRRLPATPKVTRACDGLWSHRERVLGWFDPEGTPKTREKQRESKEGEKTSAAEVAGSSEGGLKRIVVTLTEALNKNQGYLADAKKKLTFDRANITEFLIDYENLAALLKWIEEEKMDHLDTMKIGVEGFLTPEETQLIRKACQEFHLAFAFNDHQKGRLDAKLVPPVRIHTVQHECCNDKGSAYEFGIAAEITDLRRVKIDSFVAEPTASPYANKWFVFRKPNKTLRWIQDLQKLNTVTIRDTGSLPQADLLAESHAGRNIYSLIDLYSGYDQLPLDARDRPYTAMHTPVGQLQMLVTPMGFTNAVAEAQRRMFAVAGDMFPEKCEPYIDDNPVKGARYKDETEVEPGVRKFVWDHLQDIKDLLQRFLVYNITASKRNKSSSSYRCMRASLEKSVCCL
ncbi:hypothetical protein CBR_g13049 [Chara braunii]|uniref:Reverse transcriptase domain-containing protein n=1 Tax=Chara braunii TaxID=69332 RepID=A0A388KTG9_CHABU|nr:hypothetical protein CBR_g13049 [Chara braunii]|eukprot:GBG73329.1 hypothetical protein CBR_g13049 [Chara braunii]